MKTFLWLAILAITFDPTWQNYEYHSNPYKRQHMIKRGHDEQDHDHNEQEVMIENQLLDKFQNTLENIYGDERQAKKFLKGYNARLQQWNQEDAVLQWNYLTNMSPRNAKLIEDFSVKYQQWIKEQEAVAQLFYNHIDNIMDPSTQRMITLVGGYITPVGDSQEKVRQSSEISNELESIYANAKVKLDRRAYTLEPDLTRIMAESTDSDELLWAWWGWRNATGPKMREPYLKEVELLNEAAKSCGYKNAGEAERIDDFEMDDIEEQADALYNQIKPLYVQLHAYIRRQIKRLYPELKIGTQEPIPAHVLGNMWAQQWSNLFSRVMPYADIPTIDVSKTMKEQGYTVSQMFETAEEFFTSLGLEPMTQKFWSESVMTKPADRKVQCHASAHDFFKNDDFRIKMCAVVDMNDLQTIHHEMGHIEYFMQYRNQSTMYRDGANAAFHEAIGDTVALSVMTPKHLKTLRLLDNTVSDQQLDDYRMDINFLMKMALEKVAFLPFGYLMDKWRWEVFRSRIDKTNLNYKWWQYRIRYQGISPPVRRSEDDFDPGAKYHIAVNIPYMRYFFSFVGQFQFHKALCNAAGHTGPIHKCDIYRSEAAGKLLQEFMSLGASLPWPDAMEVFTGTKEFSADALLEYFSPLSDWLDEDNEDEDVGWDPDYGG